ncbi:MAG TPA: hypothetical protein VMT23_02625 [Candidatus Binatia bacterium]|nr:hypothetical protein [Candidatus Binatia bacterium]
MMEKYKLTPQSLTTIVIIVLVIIGVVIGAVLVNNNNQNSPNTQPHLLFGDSTKGQLYTTDAAGTQQAKFAYPKNSYPYFQASAPGGSLLLSVNTNTPSESFIFVQSGAQQSLPAASVSQLHASVTVNQSHQLYFVDSTTVLMVTCPDANTSCSLDKLNLVNGKMTKLLDTGVKQASSFFPQVYLVGYSASSNSAYLRVTAANKLGKSASAIYQVSLKTTKVVKTINVPVIAGYAISLSADQSKLAYQTIDVKDKTTIHISDLKANTSQIVDFSLGNLINSPEALKWSPDNKKLLVQTVSISVPASAGQSAVLKPLITAYIDTGNGNSVNDLQQIKNPARQTLVYQGWTDNDTIVYQNKQASSDYDFVNGTNQTFKENVTKLQVSNLSVPPGNLLQVTNY